MNLCLSKGEGNEGLCGPRAKVLEMCTVGGQNGKGMSSSGDRHEASCCFPLLGSARRTPHQHDRYQHLHSAVYICVR
jgi:hypothetical protein